MAPYPSNDTGSSGVCTTPACIHIASEILWSLAPNFTDIDPCNNFDQYACNGWYARHEIPAGQKKTDSLSVTNDLNRWTLKGILEAPYPTGSEAGWITVNLTDEQVAADKEDHALMQKAYNVCLNETATEQLGLDPLVAFLATVAEAFPAEPASNKTKRQADEDRSDAMGKTLLLFEKLGIPTLETMAVSQDDIDPESNIIYIGPPSFEDLPKDNDTLPEYLKVSAALLAAVHPSNISAETAGQLIKDIVELETQLVLVGVAAVLVEQVAATDDTPKLKTSLEKLDKSAPALNLAYVIGELVPDGYKADTISISGEAYFANVSNIISDTPAATVQAFFIWRAATSLAPYVVSDVTSDYNRFQVEQDGRDPDSQPDHWKDCTTHVDAGIIWLNTLGAWMPSGVSFILSRFFLDKKYTTEARDLTDKILQTLQAEFIDRLDDKDWISEDVRKVATEKVNTITRKIGYPTSPDAIDPIALKKYYADLKLTDSYLDNALALARLTVAKAYAELDNPIDRGTFFSTPATVNAYYNPQLNEIVVFAGIEQFPVFDYDFPAYLSYGGMGSIVGHELTHGFDNQGRHFDPTGNFTVWWDQHTVDEFQKRTECFVDQYSKFAITAPNGTAVHVNGNQTLGENIADSGGVAASFGAWRRWEKERGKQDAQLPGLDKFTNEQLFFLKWAQGWCRVSTPRGALDTVTKDVHSPGFARILGPLANSAAFREAFDCPVKEPTCELW